MFPFTFRPDQAVQELVRFNQKLANGMKTLTEVGPIEVGCSAREVVYTEDKLKLMHFKPLVENLHRTPVLIVYALVNRPYMADLQEDRSLIRGLLKQGLDVYLIDWGYADGADRYLNLDDYINGYIKRCVEFICDRHDVYRINLLGICQGGTFSICFAAMHPELVRNLIVTVTPVDFQTKDNLLSHWARHVDVDTVVETLGNVPGDLLNWTFLTMKPFRLTGQKYVDMVEVLDDKDKLRNFMRMEKWIFDSPDQAGEAYREFLKEFYQKNGLMKGGLTIGGKKVKPENITMPVFNVYATEDHLVPPDASRALKGIIGSKDYTEMTFKGGHIGIYVSGRAQAEIPPAIANWLKERG
ncbi:MAG: class III poly(R)-hydroxyalkanoic acid synthase subunit PhaC [Magnetococcales bacterium]|nr:class III poly(R)-hydroxyalkanoic acid synthase subunit PhaC [Magnetococcales bacterium]